MSAHWFKHDSAAFEDFKLQALMRVGGFAYIGMWWTLVEKLSTRDAIDLPRHLIPDMAFVFRSNEQDFVQFLGACVGVGLLAEHDDRFLSAGLQKRLSALKVERERKKAERSASCPENVRSMSGGHRSDKPRAASISISLSNSNSVSDLEGGSGGKPADPPGPEPGTVKLGDFCEIDEISLEQFRASKGEDFVKRAAELTNAWVGEVRADPHEFPKRRTRAKSAGFLWQNWVFRAVERERDEDAARKGRGKKSDKTANEKFTERMEQLAKL